MGWFRGVITRKAQARTSDRYDFRVFLETDGSTRSVKLPLAKYSVDGAAAEGSWALLSRCADDDSQRTARARTTTSSRTSCRSLGGGELMVVSKVPGGELSSTR